MTNLHSHWDQLYKNRNTNCLTPVLKLLMAHITSVHVLTQITSRTTCNSGNICVTAIALLICLLGHVSHKLPNSLNHYEQLDSCVHFHIYIHDIKYCENEIWFDVEHLTTGPSEAYTKQNIYRSHTSFL
jgi:hypothetical protein